MCGVAGIYVRHEDHGYNLNALADQLLMGIVNRGTDATGMAAIDLNGEIGIEKYALPAEDFINVRDKLTPDLRCVLLHTRLTTQGSEMVYENNHPVEYLNNIVTHNGVINNDKEVFTRLGCDRFAEVDTECIAASLHDISLSDTEAVGERLRDIRGSMVIASVNRDDPHTLLLAKARSNPLSIFDNGKVLVWASQASYIRDAWAKAIGSPPDFKRIETFNERTALIVGEYEDTVFEIPEPTYTPPARTYTYNGGGWNSWDSWKHYEEERRVGPNDMTFMVDDCDVCHSIGVPTTWVYDWDLTVCDKCRADELKRREGASKVIVPIYEKCPDCNITYAPSLMEGSTCKFCAEKPSDPQERAHSAGLTCAAYATKTNPKFCEELIFSSEVDELITASEYMVNMYREAEAVYFKFYDGVLSNALDDTDQAYLTVAEGVMRDVLDVS